MVEFTEEGKWAIKCTIPYLPDIGVTGYSAFGLVPVLVRRPGIDLRGDSPPPDRITLEFSPGLPLEYLDRWCFTNEIFGDQVLLSSVVLWKCGHVSIFTVQPYYDGEPARQEAIDEYFVAATWTRVRDPTGEHSLYYNYAYQILAIDAVPRNCFERDGYLMPFDVILCHPDKELEDFLRLY